MEMPSLDLEAFPSRRVTFGAFCEPCDAREENVDRSCVAHVCASCVNTYIISSGLDSAIRRPRGVIVTHTRARTHKHKVIAMPTHAPQQHARREGS